jgi:hypothetical protein
MRKADQARRLHPAFCAIILGLVCAGSPAPAQEVDEIVARYVAALGGIEKIHGLHSLRKTGTYVYNGLEHPVVVIQERDAGCREEIDGLSEWGTSIEPGEKVVRAWDGRNAWVGRLADALEARPMPEGEAAGFILDADIESSLVEWAQKGGQVTVVGATEVEGVAVVQLAVTRRDGAVEQWYLDRDTSLPVMKATEVPEGEFKAAMTWYFDDYREVSGVRMPFYVLIEEKLFTREYLFDEIEANVAVADGFFSPPGAPGALPGE